MLCKMSAISQSRVTPVNVIHERQEKVWSLRRVLYVGHTTTLKAMDFWVKIIYFEKKDLNKLNQAREMRITAEKRTKTEKERNRNYVT
jgi:hypothetical protein